jgi:hypothetical protein
VWAAGAAGTLLHYDGASWKAVASSTKSALRAVVGIATNDAWAAGDGDTAIHWNGKVWSAVPTSTSGSNFRAAWAAATNDVWLAGASGQMLHWDGAGWNSQPSGAADITSDFVAMTGLATNDVWAVTPQRVVHFDGSAWAQYGTSAADSMTGIADVPGVGAWISSARGTLANLLTTDPLCSASTAKTCDDTQCCWEALVACHAIAAKLSYQRLNTSGSYGEVARVAETSPANASSYTDSSTGQVSYRVCNVDQPSKPVCTKTMAINVPTTCTKVIHPPPPCKGICI